MMLRRLFSTLSLLAGLVLSGCAEAPSPAGAPPGASADSAFVLLEAIQRDAMEGAFDDLDRLGYLRLIRTEQIADGAVAAYFERLVRLRPDAPPATMRADSGGTFQFGLIGRFADTTPAEATAADPAAHVLPEDPAFLSARNREAFVYTLEPDTTWFDRPARVVTIRARPGTGDRQAVRRARLYVDGATRQLVGLTLERREDTWLYGEASRFELRLRPAGDAWRPHLTDFLTTTRLPFSPTRTFRTTSSYYPASEAP